MVIKNNDGTVFKLKGPNALMKTQEYWDKKHIKLINFENINKIIEVIDPKNKIREMKEEIPDISRIIAQAAERATIEETMPENAEEAPSEITIVEQPSIEQSEINWPENFVKLYDKRKVKFLAVEAIQKEYKDDLYGDSYSKTEFANKFEFFGLILDQNDFELLIWTDQKISFNSIIYSQNHMKRWWSIKEDQKKSGGFIYTCILSELNPYF